MNTITLYVIRNTLTGALLPNPGQSKRRGYSFVEPVIFNSRDEGKHTPRFFGSRKSARGALTSWLMGKHKAYYGSEGDLEDLKIIPQATRVREDMEIVEVQVQIP